MDFDATPDPEGVPAVWRGGVRVRWADVDGQARDAILDSMEHLIGAMAGRLAPCRIGGTSQGFDWTLDATAADFGDRDAEPLEMDGETDDGLVSE